MTDKTINASASESTLLRICRRGHQVTTANASFKKHGGRIYAECEQCAHAYRIEYYSSPCRTLTEQKARRVIEALQEGETLSVILFGRVSYTYPEKGKRVGQYVKLPICTRRALNNFCTVNKAFGDLVSKMDQRNRAAQQQSNSMRRKFPKELSSCRASERAFGAVQRATRGVCDKIREDVQGEMLLAIAEGRLRPADAAARVSDYVAAINRANQHSVINKFGNRSLDAPLSAESQSTLADTITRGLWQ